MNVIRKPYFNRLNQASLARSAPIPLRLIVGYGFMQHGFAKLSKGPEAFAIILHAIGVPRLISWHGLRFWSKSPWDPPFLLGALVPLASVPMAAVLLVAIFTVHLPYGFSTIKLISVTSGHAHFGPPGYETG